jgi:aldehyde:ferredoxin oxidoreductase
LAICWLKGQLPGYECRATKIVGLGYATASRGGCHNQGGPQLPAQAGLECGLIEYSIVKEPLEPELPTDVAIVKNMEDAITTIDCLGNCKFVMGIENSHEDLRTAMANVIGHEFSYEDFLKFGERAYNIERVFSVREGITRADDTLPRRLLEEPVPDGPAKGQVAVLDILLDRYYQLRGWTNNGIPTPERLKELGLEDLIKYLPKKG